MSSFGDQIDEFQVGPVRVIVRYSCVRRDQYELLAQTEFPAELQARLAAHGTLRGTPVLYTVDVTGTHQLTVAPRRGRLVIMPRLTVERPQQRESALAVANLIAEVLGERPPTA
jgi:hypothetical protein